MSGFCWHVWKIEKSEVLESDFEQAKRLGERPTHYVHYMMKKQCLVTSKCQKCGTERVERV